MGLWSSRTDVLVRRGRHQEHVGAWSTQQGVATSKPRTHYDLSLQNCEKIDLLSVHKYILLWQLSRLRHTLCLICSCPQPQTKTTRQDCYLSILINVAAPIELFWSTVDRSEVCLSSFSVDISPDIIYGPHLWLFLSVNDTPLPLSCGSVVSLPVSMLLLTSWVLHMPT